MSEPMVDGASHPLERGEEGRRGARWRRGEERRRRDEERGRRGGGEVKREGGEG